MSGLPKPDNSLGGWLAKPETAERFAYELDVEAERRRRPQCENSGAGTA